MLVTTGDPLAVMQSVLVAATAVSGAAGVVYNLLAEKLFDKLNLAQVNMLPVAVEGE